MSAVDAGEIPAGNKIETLEDYLADYCRALISGSPRKDCRYFKSLQQITRLGHDTYCVFGQLIDEQGLRVYPCRIERDKNGEYIGRFKRPIHLQVKSHLEDPIHSFNGVGARVETITPEDYFPMQIGDFTEEPDEALSNVTPTR